MITTSLEVLKEVIKIKHFNKLFRYPRIYNFLEDKEIKSLTRLDSIWRSGNTILLIDLKERGAGKGKYVFKALENPEHVTEINQINLMKEYYPSFLPNIHCVDGPALLMDYVGGNNLFGLFRMKSEREILDILASGAKSLCETYKSYQGERGVGNALSQIDYTLSHYAKKAVGKKNLSQADYTDLERYLANWQEALYGYSSQIVHNDLNMGNVIFSSNGLRAIDPEFDPLSTIDVAKDVGRYCASVFFNSFDYYKQDWRVSRSCLNAFYESFLSNFSDETLPERILFYFAQSALSFSNFPTNGNLKPEDFLDLSLSIFQKGPEKIKLDSLQGLTLACCRK